MDFAGFLHELRQAPSYRGQIVYYAREAPRAAQYAAESFPLARSARTALEKLGLRRLYVHQAEGLAAWRAGRDVLLTTGPASGKSLVYQLAILELLEADPTARVLLIFPLKALAQDQAQGLQRLLQLAGRGDILCGCYDGDTPAAMRRRLRDEGQIILTNPEMIHAGILPQHTRWAAFLANLELIVLDELHSYSGLFGANVANVWRRLERIWRHYRGPGETNAARRAAGPRVICSSGTIGNPAELAERLTGRQPEIIAKDGSPAGARHWVFWNPPLIYGRRRRARRSANVEATELMAELIRRGVPTITFSKAKVTAELIYRYVTERLRETAPALAEKVMPYRGGYLPEERREIERRLFTGELLGVSCTRALELGIDVGELDASLMVGYPGRLASFFQQAGRAGRRGRDALVLFIGLDTSINQYILQHPEYIFGRPLEEVVADPDNPYVTAGHLRCATHEQPLREEEAPPFGPAAEEALGVLEELRQVRRSGGRYWHATVETPQFLLPLRASVEAEVVIQERDTRAVIGHIGLYDAPHYLHPGAIYLHYGETYLVETLDLSQRVAYVRPVEVDYYTQPLDHSGVHHVDRILRSKPFGAGKAYFGEVTAYYWINEYECVHFYRLDAFERRPVSPPVPTLQLETMAFWLVPDEALMQAIVREGLEPYSGLRGIAYGLRMLLPLFVTCDTLDLGQTIGCTNAPWQSIFIYERYPLGLGYTERAYERLGEIMPALYQRITECPCRHGCPACVGEPLRPEMTSWNVERGEGDIASKKTARRILEALLADPARLWLPEEESLGQDEAEARWRLRQGLRRRLERQTFPAVFHPVEREPPRGYPAPEPPPARLSDTEMARRAWRRRVFEKEEERQARQEEKREAARALEGAARPEKGALSAPPEHHPQEIKIADTSAEEGQRGGGEGKTKAHVAANAPRVLGDPLARAALRRTRRAAQEEK